MGSHSIWKLHDKIAVLAMLLSLSFGRKPEDGFFLFCFIVFCGFMNDYSVTQAEQSPTLKKSCFAKIR